MNDSPVAQSGFLERLARHPVPVLLLICLFAWLPGLLALPPLDRDESRFAQASKQMIETGDYVDIRFSSVPRYNKPVGIYWAQAAATRALGHPPYNQIWTYRLPSLLGAVLAVLLTYWTARAFAVRECAFLAGAVLALCVALSAEADMATTDALLLATVVGAQGFLLRVYLHARGLLAEPPSLTITLAAWLAVGAGILLKGPLIIAVLGLTALTLSLWDRNWRWLRGLRFAQGIPMMAAMVLPWAIAIAFASHGAFYQRSLGHDFAAKIMSGQESHGAPPGYYLALFSITFWPATLFALPAIGNAVVRRAEPVFRFLLCWAIPNWLLFEAVPTKLPHYILPIYPAFALMTAIWVFRPGEETCGRAMRGLNILATVAFALVTVLAAATLLLIPPRFGGGTDILAILGVLCVAILGGVAVMLRVRGTLMLAAASALATALLSYPLLTAGVGPKLNALWMSPDIAAQAAELRRHDDPPVILAGYVEPSLVFLLGTDTRLQTGKIAGASAARQGGLAIVEDHDRSHFLQALHAAGGKEQPAGQLSGFDYSRGRNEHVTFYRITAATADFSPPPE